MLERSLALYVAERNLALYVREGEREREKTRAPCWREISRPMLERDYAPHVR